MHFSLASIALAALASTASAANFTVQVGVSSQLAFSPTNVTAAVGDTISFIFSPKNHTVTQSSFTAPCQPLSGSVESGFQPVAAGASNVPSFTITVNPDNPYLVLLHCEQGMVFAVNPTAIKSCEAFQATAKASSADGTPPSSSNSTGSGSSSSSTGSATGSVPSSTTSSKSNGAVAASARAGGLLAMAGFVAGMLL